MESINPYQSPSADVALHGYDAGFDTSSPFSPNGRFGRMSYLAWAMAVYLPVWLISVLVSVTTPTAAAGAPEAMSPVSMILSIVMVIYMIPMVVFMWLFAIRRLHDFNASGWWSLLFLLPVANMFFGLVLLLRRGTEGRNDFGPQRLTRGWERSLGILGVVMLVIAVIGIVAAIAIPYYTAAH